MPAISQIGFGTNDYATIAAWWTAEQNNDYSGVGPIAEIDSSAPQTLTANLQIRFGSSTRATIRASAGSEFDGNFGGTHAKILGGFNLDVRKDNFTLSGIDFTGSVVSSGDTYNGLSLDGSGIRGDVYLDKVVTTPVDLTNTLIYSATTTNNRVCYINGTDTNLSAVTIVATNVSTPLGSIYVRNNASDVTINNTCVYSVGDTYEIHSGDTPTVTGDYNAGSDALLLGANSIATLGTDDFVDFASLDFRIKSTSELIGAGSSGGNIGAFVETLVNQPPVANDDTFAIFNNIANGATVGTYTATDDTAVTNYTITGTTLTINASGLITIASNAGITAGVPIVETVTAYDGEALTDTATITVNVTAPKPGITTVGPVRLGETVAVTVDGSVDLSAATTVTVTYGGISVAVSGITASAFNFTAPSEGLELNANHDLIVTADGEASTASSQTLLPPTGYSVVTLTSIDTNSWLNDPDYIGNAGGDANNISIGDQIVYQSVTVEGAYPVIISVSGLVTLTGASAETNNQTLSWFYLDAQDSYGSGATAVLTLIMPGGEPPIDTSTDYQIILRDILKPVLSNVLKNIFED